MTDELARLQLALCLAEKECPECEGDCLITSQDTPFKICDECNTTGKVPLLEGVREKCPHIHYGGFGETDSCAGCGVLWKAKYYKETNTYSGPNPEHGKGCECQGRGWVPPTDLFKYAKALYQIWEHDVRYDQELLEIGFGVFKGELALLSNIAKALGVK
ncbi:hypothetical protein KKH23_06770 [Patescibacteria group bacterium]|uniref:Uncharacterized protein n=1 Tax=viral metagenome TaxID=1070528 RepID=A0A6M3M827_9ZZZZ|nr:hypothetical protein [Patescibacteria group bacterium]